MKSIVAGMVAMCLALVGMLAAERWAADAGADDPGADDPAAEITAYGLPAAPAMPLVVRDPIGEVVCVLWADGELELRRAPETVVRLLLLRQQSLVVGMRKELRTLREAVGDGRSQAGE